MLAAKAAKASRLRRTRVLRHFADRNGPGALRRPLCFSAVSRPPGRPLSSLSRLPVLLTLVLMSHACAPDKTLPDDVRVACDPGSSCPEGFVCNKAGRCEATGALDRDAPTVVGGVSVGPLVGGLESNLAVSFAVSEAMAREPVVTVDLGTRQAALQLRSVEGHRYEYGYETTGGEPEGQRQLTILLVDRSGNEGHDRSASLGFDFSPPRVLTHRLDTGWLKHETVARLVFEASEELGRDPELSFEDGRLWSLEAREGEVFTYLYEADATQDVPGLARVLVVVEDDAQNRSQPIELGQVHFDFEPPGLNSAQILPAHVRLGGSWLLELVADESLAEPPRAFSHEGPGPLELGEPTQQGQTYHWTREVAAGEDAGEYGFTVELRDQAGNTSTRTLEARLEIDKSPPRVIQDTWSVGPARRLRAGDSLAVEVSVSEELAGPPALFVGATRVAAEPLQDELRYGYTWRVQGPEGEDAVASLVIEMEDLAGNRTSDGSTLGQVVLDLSAPICVPSVEPSPAGALDRVRLALDCSETLGDGSPELQVRRLPDGAWGAFAEASRSGLSYVFQRAVAEGLTTGRYGFRTRLVDLAGNRTPAIPDAWESLGVELLVDDEGPWILDAPGQPEDPWTSQGGLFKAGDTLVVAFTVNEDLPQPPLVLLRGRSLGAPEEVVGRRYTYEHGVQGTPEDSGVFGLAVELVDGAGNRTSDHATLGQVTLDFTPPRVVAARPSAAAYGASDRVVYTVDVDESLMEDEAQSSAGVPLLRVQRDGELVGDVLGVAERVSATRFVYAVEAAELPEGSYEVTIGIVDRAGNPALGLPGQGFAVDRVAPAYVQGLTDDLPSAGLIFGIEDPADLEANDLTFHFVMEERGTPVGVAPDACLAQCPLVLLGGEVVGDVQRAPVLDSPEDGRWGFRYSYRVRQEDWGPLERDLDVAIRWADGAGNTTETLLVREDPGTPGGEPVVVRFDFKRPWALGCVLLPSTPNASSTLSYSVSSSEFLPAPPALDVDSLVEGLFDEETLVGPGPGDEDYDGYVFTWAQSAQGLSSGLFDIETTLVDAAGNESDGPVCSKGALLDTLPPRLASVDLDAPAVWEVPGGGSVWIVGSGQTVHITAVFEEAVGLSGNGPVIRLMAPAPLDFDPAWVDIDGTPGPGDPLGCLERPATPGVWHCAAELQLDEVADVEAEGEWPVQLEVADAHGNMLRVEDILTGARLRTDFTAPTAACVLNLPLANQDDTVEVSASFSEPLAAPPTLRAVVVEPEELAGSSLSFERTPGIDPRAARPSTAFVLPSDTVGPDVTWAYTVVARDLAGNESEEACRGDGRIDRHPIIVSPTPDQEGQSMPYVSATFEGLATGTHARDGSEVTIRFVLSDAPPVDKISLVLPPLDLEGREDVVRIVSEAEGGGTQYEYRYVVHQATHSTGPTPVWLTVSDEAGNRTVQSLATLLLDYAAPRLAGTALFSRCDSRQSAQVAPNALWVGAAAPCPDGQGWPVEVAFSVGELLGPTPTVTVDGLPLAHLPDRSGDTYFVFGLTPSGNERQTDSADPAAVGTDVLLHARDPAGNSSDVSLGSLRFDYDSPTALRDQDQRSVELFRAPWGCDGCSGAPYTEFATCPLPGEGPVAIPTPRTPSLGCTALSSPVFEPESTVSVFRAERAADGRWMCGADDRPDSGLLASLRLSPSLPRTPLQVPGDWQAVCVGQQDPAGNRSPRALVENVAWVATLGGKERGSESGNPHRFQDRPWFRSVLQQHGVVEAGASDGLAHRSEGVAHTVEGNGTWRLRDRAAPSAVWTPRLAYDSIRGITVMFGRDQDGGATWEWDGLEWRSRTPLDPEGDGNPPGREVHAMAFDSRRGVVVLFGGNSGPDWQYGDTWEWDGSSWAHRTPADPEGDGDPVARSQHAMGFDSENGVVVLFGGSAYFPDRLLEDTWEWDGVSWRRLVYDDPSGDGEPGAMWPTPSMFFDRATKELRLQHQTGQWRLVGQDWRRVEPEAFADASIACTGGPDSVGLHVDGSEDCVCDAARSVVVRVRSRGVVDEWDGNDWTPKTASRALGGGDDSSTLAAQAWHSIVYDAQLGVVRVLSHGLAEGYQGEFDQTAAWEWNGTTWSVAARDERPDLPGRAACLGFVGGDGVARLLTHSFEVLAESGQAWTVGGCGNGWESEGGYAAGYDVERGRLVEFGDEGGTWEWDGDSWALVAVQGPPGDTQPKPRAFHAMVWDARRARTVMFGGGGEGIISYVAGHPDDEHTWEWDGANWARIVPEDPEGDGEPAERLGHAMWYDSRRGTVMLFGGRGATAWFDDLWEWNGVRWTRHILADPEGDGVPTPRAGHAVAFDGERGVAVLHGGWEGMIAFEETWELDSGIQSRPGQSFTVDFAEAVTGTRHGMREVTARWFAAGVGYPGSPDGVRTPGAQLYVWLDGEWQTVAENIADPDQPENANGDAPWQLAWTGSDSLQLRRSLVGSEPALHFAAVSSQPNGVAVANWTPARGRLATDYVEAKVSYRLGELVGWGFGTTGIASEPDAMSAREGWTLEGGAAFCESRLPGHLCVEWGAVAGRLLSPRLRLSAERFTVLEFQGTGPDNGLEFDVRWQRWEELEPAEGRSVTVVLQGGPGGQETVARVLLDHEDWHGTIAQLAIDLPADPAGAEGQRLEIGGIYLMD